MAVVTVKSSRISGRDSTPPAKGGLTLGPRRLYDDAATVEITNGDSIASKYVLATVPSHASMRELIVLNDAVTSAAADFGIYRTTQDGAAVVSVALFGSAVSLASANLTGTNVLHESLTLDIAKIEQPLWQLAGLTADPCIDYDIVATLTAAATASGTLTVRTTYAQSN
jgi:hypothetical protein